MSHFPLQIEPVSRMLRADPFRGFDDFFSELRHLPFRRGDMAPSVRMDVTESEKAYTVTAELPGVKKEDIKVSIDGKRVTITANTEAHSEDKSATLICSERSWGQFYRNFTLPQDVDDGQAAATFNNGVLALTLPKRTGGNGKALAIS